MARRTPRVEWLGRITEAEKLARLAGRHRLLHAGHRARSRSASCCSRRWPPGTCVLASDIPGYRNVARHDVNAWMVPPDDAEALLRRAAPAARCGRSPRPTRRGGHRRASLDFSLHRLAERYVEVYEQAISDRGRRPGLNPVRRGRRSRRPVAAAAYDAGRSPPRRPHGHRHHHRGRRGPADPVRDRHVQRAGPDPEPHRQRLLPDRRAAQAPPRPDPEPGRDGEGLRRPREGRVRVGHRRPGRTRSTRRTHRPRPQAQAENAAVAVR